MKTNGETGHHLPESDEDLDTILDIGLLFRCWPFAVPPGAMPPSAMRRIAERTAVLLQGRGPNVAAVETGAA